MLAHVYRIWYLIPGIDNKSIRQWPENMTVFEDERENTAHPGDPLHVGPDWGWYNTTVKVRLFTELGIRGVRREIDSMRWWFLEKEGTDRGMLNLLYSKLIRNPNLVIQQRMKVFHRLRRKRKRGQQQMN